MNNKNLWAVAALMILLLVAGLQVARYEIAGNAFVVEIQGPVDQVFAQMATAEALERWLGNAKVVASRAREALDLGAEMVVQQKTWLGNRSFQLQITGFFPAEEISVSILLPGVVESYATFLFHPTENGTRLEFFQDREELTWWGKLMSPLNTMQRQRQLERVFARFKQQAENSAPAQTGTGEVPQ